MFMKAELEDAEVSAQYSNPHALELSGKYLGNELRHLQPFYDKPEYVLEDNKNGQRAKKFS